MNTKNILIIILKKNVNKNAKLGFSKAMANGWIEVDKKNEGGPKVVRKVMIYLKKISKLNDLNFILNYNLSRLKTPVKMKCKLC